jgi:hypothetical protein
MGREPVAVDILSEIPEVDFDAAWERRIEDVIDHATGTTDVEAIQRAAESQRLGREAFINNPKTI